MSSEVGTNILCVADVVKNSEQQDSPKEKKRSYGKKQKTPKQNRRRRSSLDDNIISLYKYFISNINAYSHFKFLESNS